MKNAFRFSRAGSFVLGVAAAACLAGGVSPSVATVIDGIAATVNGQVITLLDLEKAGRPLVERKLLGALKREHAALKREALGTVLESLIMKELQHQRARQLGIRIGDPEIDEAIANIMNTNALTDDMLARALVEQGLTMEEYRRQIGDQILFSRLMQQEVRARVAVTPEEVEAYYREHEADYFQPERIRVRHLLVKVEEPRDAEATQQARQKALKILEEFRAGAEFSDLVARYSPDTAYGGETVSGWLKRGEFLQELEEIAFTLPPGKVSEPIRSQAGFHIIQVVEKQEASNLSQAAVSDSIMEKIGRGKMESEYKRWLEELRDSSQIDILY